MRYLAFLRAVNVGGRVVKMDDLRARLEGIPLSHVSTFIASGNVLFESTSAPRQLEMLIEKRLESWLGYEVVTMVRTPRQIAAVAEHAARDLDDAGVRLYVGFLKRLPTAASAKAAAALSTDVDRLSVHEGELYWQCRTSFGESTTSGARLEKLLGPLTIRNINTVRRLAAKTAAERRAQP